MKESVNIIYYNKEYNFGDQISPFIVEQLLNKELYYLDHNIRQKEHSKCIIAVGSYIQKAYPHTHIWGSGLPTKNSPFSKNITDVHAVRGPLTRDTLIKKGINVPEVYGDPALLMPELYKPTINQELHDKVVVIPHKSNYTKYKEKEEAIDSSKFRLISPKEDWKYVINSIASCKAVLSESLHGLICADAYNIPNLWLYEHGLIYGKFKFKDYFMSQNRPIKNVGSIEQFDMSLCYTGGNSINMSTLKSKFPF